MRDIINWLLNDALGLGAPSWLVALVGYVAVATLLFLIVPFQMLFFTMYERRAIARMQDRIGPNRVGPEGAFQPVADGVKMFTKEDIVPAEADRWVHLLAPCVVVAPTMLMFAVLPWGPGMAPADLSVGLLFFLAVSSVSAVGILMAGWGSNNKFALLGAMRGVAQMVSYEIPAVLSLLAVVLFIGAWPLQGTAYAAGGLLGPQQPGFPVFGYGGSVVQAVYAQSGLPFVGMLAGIDAGLGWFVFSPVGLVAFVCFFIAALAEGERTPFDIPEADSEIVAGYMTEYSGMKFGLFYLAQYVLNFLLCALTATLFFGGWQGPGVAWLLSQGVTPANPEGSGLFNVLAGVLGVFYFLAKTYFFFYVMIWVRGAYPRLRVDQLMGFGWKFLIPLTLVNILSAALWVACLRWGAPQGLPILDTIDAASGSWGRWGAAFVLTALINAGTFYGLARVNQAPADPLALEEDQVFGAVTLP
jgi:NADH-quinone oxidoreductase subunit H